MNKELIFAETLEHIMKTAREQNNCVSETQIREAFRVLELTKEQLQMVYDYLKKHAVGIGEPAAPEDFLTETETDYLKEYQELLRQLPAATEGEKEAAFLSAMAGEKEAQNRLTEIFLVQVPEIARLYVNQGVLLDDLIGQGNMAVSEGVRMLGAMENAEEAEGMLTKMIMDSMEELVSSHFEEAKTDKEIEERVNQIAGKAHDLAEEMRRKVTVAELSEETGIPEEEIRIIYRTSGYAIEDLEDK